MPLCIAAPGTIACDLDHKGSRFCRERREPIKAAPERLVFAQPPWGALVQLILWAWELKDLGTRIETSQSRDVRNRRYLDLGRLQVKDPSSTQPSQFSIPWSPTAYSPRTDLAVLGMGVGLKPTARPSWVVLEPALPV